MSTHRNALHQIAAALDDLAGAIRELAGSEDDDREDDAVELLWDRLGLESQKFLYELAVDFTPEAGAFGLEDVSTRLDLDPASARSRLMTIGRSARALGGRAPALWKTHADPATRRRRYEWSPEAHAAVMRLVEG